MLILYYCMLYSVLTTDKFLSNAVFYQFDDICMKNPGWHILPAKWTKIDEVRLNFLKTVMTHLMSHQNEDLPHLQHILECFQGSVKRRVWGCKTAIEYITLSMVNVPFAFVCVFSINPDKVHNILTLEMHSRLLIYKQYVSIL